MSSALLALVVSGSYLAVLGVVALVTLGRDVRIAKAQAQAEAEIKARAKRHAEWVNSLPARSFTW